MRRSKGGELMGRSQACREFINRNIATGSQSNKSPELVAKYADALLKKSNKAGEEADLDTALRNTVSHEDTLICRIVAKKVCRTSTFR